jgi:hemerythrin-like domain-containing protein
MHVEAGSAFQKLEGAAPNERGAIWAKLRPELEAHEQMEERFVYDPAVREANGAGSKLAQFHSQHEQEVQHAKRMIEEIGGMDGGESQFMQTVQNLHHALAKHIDMEETEFWPQIRQSWGEQRLEQAGTQVQAAKTAVSAGSSVSEALSNAAEAVKGT